METNITRFTLSNGLRVIVQHMSQFHSVALGVWVRSGSVDERAEENGYSHFIEHMLFKGTDHLSAADLAEQMDLLGGQVNAFTSKESTCFHAKVAGDDAENAFSLLSQLVLEAKLDPDELEREKGVVLEEISMVEDTPEDVVHDLLAKAYFTNSSLGRTILGPAQNIKQLTREKLVSYKNRYYTAKNSVLSVAGGIDPETVRTLAERYFSAWETGDDPVRIPFAEGQPQQLTRIKNIEQAHLCLGFAAPKQASEMTYPVTVFNTVAGGGMSSRLFQTIREEMGLAYSVYSYPSYYNQSGIFTIYAGMAPANTQKVIDAIAQQLADFKKDCITRAEYDKSKQLLRASFVLGQESTLARMQAIGRAELFGEKVRTFQETMERLENTTYAMVCEGLQNVLSSPFASALVSSDPTADLSSIEHLRAL